MELTNLMLLLSNRLNSTIATEKLVKPNHIYEIIKTITIPQRK